MRTLAKALQLAGAGDTIVLAKTDAPYRESISLVGSRHSGTSQQPFTIQGNGAILDGSAPAPAEAWEHYKGAIFRLRVRPTGNPQLFLDGRPAVRVFAAQAAKEPARSAAAPVVLGRGANLFLRRKEQAAGRLQAELRPRANRHHLVPRRARAHRRSDRAGIPSGRHQPVATAPEKCCCRM